MLKIIGVFLGVLIAAVVVLAALAYFRVILIPGPLLARFAGSGPPEHSARYYPPDTLVYAWVTLTPSGGQFNDMMDIWERFSGFPAFEDLVEEIKEEFASETGIDFDEDVASWIGPDASVGLIGYDSREDILDIAATVGVRDHDAAADFMRQWLDYMESSEGADFDRASRRDFDIWVDDGEHQAYALSKDLLIFATSEDTLDDVIDLVEGDGDRSLASDENFQAARKALPDQRFTSGYIDVSGALELSESFADDAFMAAPFFGVGGLGNRVPDWVAGTGAWVERGIVLEYVAPGVTETELEIDEIEDPSRLLHADTLGYLAFAFDPNLDRWRDELDEYDLADVLPFPGMSDEINYALEDFALSQGISPTPQLPDNADLADVLDVALEFAYELSGVDFEAEFFAYLEGEFILAVSEFDFEEMEDDPANHPVNAVAILSYDQSDEEDLRDTMGDLTLLVEEYLPFIEANREDVGADEDAVVFPIEFTEYDPGYVLHEGYLTLGSTGKALEAVVERQNGDLEVLAADGEHQRAVGHLPGEKNFVGYVNLQSIIRQFEAEDMDLEPGEYRIIREGLGSVAVGGSEADDYARGGLVLTLFPE